MTPYDYVFAACKLLLLLTLLWFLDYLLSKKELPDKWTTYSIHYEMIYYGSLTALYLILTLLMFHFLVNYFYWPAFCFGVIFLYGSIITGMRCYNGIKYLKKQKED